MKDEDNMAEKKNEMRGEERHSFHRAVFIFGGRKRGLNAEDAEEARRDHRDKKEERNGLPLACKSPPFPPAADEGWGGLKFRWAAA